MKMEKLLIGLMALGMLAFVSCNYAGNSSGGSGFSLSNYAYTAEVQLMNEDAIIIGDDKYNPITGSSGAFPKGRIVKLSPFIMGKYEVTQELYEVVMNENNQSLNNDPSSCSNSSVEYKNMLDGEEQKYRPVESVTWYDAVYFCNALSEKMGLNKAYTITNISVSGGHINNATVTFDKTANGYRLPTEAEWEYAARGGKAGMDNGTFKYYFSGKDSKDYSTSPNEDLDSVGWYFYNLKTGDTKDGEVNDGEKGAGSHSVGKKNHNAAGLFDMSGNVNEWCYDQYNEIITVDDSKFTENNLVVNPFYMTESCSENVIRGGNWNCDCNLSAVSYREYYYTPGDISNDVGFRVCRNVK